MMTGPTGQAVLHVAQHTMLTCDWKSIVKYVNPVFVMSIMSIFEKEPCVILTLDLNERNNVSMQLRFSRFDNQWLYKDIVHTVSIFYTW